ncbi:MAG: hypothetical protein M1829_006331 [Trizodia sp. TS-e1964]|nr:MAG: hypothetical protein M1829_006331 [Trizodia sp. TS-e1964]
MSARKASTDRFRYQQNVPSSPSLSGMERAARCMRSSGSTPISVQSLDKPLPPVPNDEAPLEGLLKELARPWSCSSSFYSQEEDARLESALMQDQAEPYREPMLYSSSTSNLPSPEQAFFHQPLLCPADRMGLYKQPHFSSSNIHQREVPLRLSQRRNLKKHSQESPKLISMSPTEPSTFINVTHKFSVKTPIVTAIKPRSTHSNTSNTSLPFRMNLTTTPEEKFQPSGSEIDLYPSPLTFRKLFGEGRPLSGFSPPSLSSTDSPRSKIDALRASFMPSLRRLTPTKNSFSTADKHTDALPIKRRRVSTKSTSALPQLRRHLSKLYLRVAPDQPHRMTLPAQTVLLSPARASLSSTASKPARQGLLHRLERARHSVSVHVAGESVKSREKRKKELKRRIVIIGEADQFPDGRVNAWL